MNYRRRIIWPARNGGGGQTYVPFVGTDGLSVGVEGLVPAPQPGDIDKFIRGDGSWADAVLDPMTNIGDIIINDDYLVPARLGIGTVTQVLSVGGFGLPVWSDAFQDPTLVAGDIIIRNSSGDVDRLVIGTHNQVLRVNTNVPEWQDDFLDPMTDEGDMIVRQGGAPTALPIGNDGEILKVNGTQPQWVSTTSLGILIDPMTDIGDIIIRDGTNTTVRLPRGTDQQVLRINGTVPDWTSELVSDQVGPIFTITNTRVGTGDALNVGTGLGTDNVTVEIACKSQNQGGVGVAVTGLETFHSYPFLADVYGNISGNAARIIHWSRVSCDGVAPTAGFGARAYTDLQTGSSGATHREASYVDTLWLDGTDASRKSEYVISLANMPTLAIGRKWTMRGDGIMRIGSASVYVGFKAGASGTTDYTWPTAFPGADTGYYLTSDTLGNLSWATASATTTFADNVFAVQDNGDATKQLMFQVSGVTPATIRLATVPDRNFTLDKIDTASELSVGGTHYVPFQTSANLFSGSVNFRYDAANNSLGLGVAPASTARLMLGGTGRLIDVVGSSSTGNMVNITVTGSSGGLGGLGIQSGASLTYCINLTASHATATGIQVTQSGAVTGFGTGSGLYVNMSSTSNTGAGITALNQGNSASAVAASWQRISNVTNSIINIIDSSASSSGTPAAGFGLANNYTLETSTTASVSAARMIVAWSDATHASRTSYIEFETANSATAEALIRFAKAITTPNATIPVLEVTAKGSATNIDFATIPKGSGALLAATPDNTAAGGNKRGANAVDWQTVRGSASQVASGDRSVIVGGKNNTAATNDSIAMGVGSITQYLGSVAYAYNAFGTAGESQEEKVHWMGTTTDATPTVITIGNSGQSLAVASNSTLRFEIDIVARRTDAADEAAYKLTGLIHNNSGTTALTGTVTKVDEQETDATWDVAATADNTTDSLILTVTGAGGKTIKWTAVGRILSQTN